MFFFGRGGGQFFLDSFLCFISCSNFTAISSEVFIIFSIELQTLWHFVSPKSCSFFHIIALYFVLFLESQNPISYSSFFLLTISYHPFFLCISKVWNMLHHGLVGRVQSKDCSFKFICTFSAANTFLIIKTSLHLCHCIALKLKKYVFSKNQIFKKQTNKKKIQTLPKVLQNFTVLIEDTY